MRERSVREIHLEVGERVNGTNERRKKKAAKTKKMERNLFNRSKKKPITEQRWSCQPELALTFGSL